MEKIALNIAKARGKNFWVKAQELVTGRTAVIAQTGAGKSWTIGVICEQLCKSNIGFCIIDTEETKISGAMKCKLSEHDLRNALKALEPTCEVTRFEVFYYPTHAVRFEKRTMRIDGITGKNV